MCEFRKACAVAEELRVCLIKETRLVFGINYHACTETFEEEDSEEKVMY